MSTVNLGRIKPIYQGIWSSGTAYNPLDFVKHTDGLTYFCILATTAGTAPTNTTYWQPVVSGITAATLLTMIETVDGAGSGLDADMVDGVHAASFAAASDLSSHTGNTSNPHSVTKSQVGLGNCDNTSDANKPVSTAQQTALDLKAPLASPTFTGTVVLPATTSIGTATSTELGYVHGVTSGIQAQISAKVSQTSSTGSAVLPAGSTAQRDSSPSAGYLRYNSTLAKPEVYNGSAWGSVGGGATGGGSDAIFIENGQTVTTNYTITTGNNAGSFGPVTVNSGVTVTVPSGSRWTIV